MAFSLWSQDVFSKGELSPLMYSRVSTDAYYKALKTATNVITYPQGAAGKRFGTLFLNQLNGITNFKQSFFNAFNYSNECVYLVVFIPMFVNIYLEGFLVAQIATEYDGGDMPYLDYTVLDVRFRVASGHYPPQDLVRAPNSGNVITGISGNMLTLTSAITSPIVYPIRFTNSGGMGDHFPITSPQIKSQRTYFIYANSTTTVTLYLSATDAKAQINPIRIISNGVGTTTMFVQNTWSIADVVFRNKPVFDFTGGYDTFTFTPSATTGIGINLTCDNAIFGNQYIGGAYFGGGGILRITAITSTTVAVGNVVVPFTSTNAISGSLSTLSEPAWSEARGWPTKCSSFQNRAFFANTDDLPNGLWGSVVNDYDDFDDLETDDDSAISWYPSSDNINFIQFIVPYRSLTVHTNSGVFSTPLSAEVAITPNNFSMTLQDSTPAQSVEPRAIDNQIIILSGNDAHSLLWDGFNAAYNTNIVSVANEQVIRTPIDEAEFVDLDRAGSRYMFITNLDGSLAIYQTLVSEDVSGFTPCETVQDYGNAYFRWVTSSFDGRAWFLVERQIATAQSPIAISGFSSITLTAIASNFPVFTPTEVKFSTTGSLPISNPQLELDTYYWVVGASADTFAVYLTQADALGNINPIQFSSAGTSSTVIPWRLITNFYIEEISFDLFMDCCYTYIGSPVGTITGLDRFNGQNVLINGDGFEYEALVSDGTVNLEAHGLPRTASVIQLGFPIEVDMEPLPISVIGGIAKETNLLMPKHIRNVGLMFADTIGGDILIGDNNLIPIQLKTLDQTHIGFPPTAVNGVMNFTPLRGWTDFNNPQFRVVHRAAYSIKLLGIFYKLET